MRPGGNAYRHPFVVCPAADEGDQVELPAHLVPNKSIGLGLGNPAGQQLIGVFPAVGEAEWDAGQVAKQSRRERILTVHGEDHGRIEPSTAEPIDHREVGLGFGRKAVAFNQGAS